MWRKEEGGRLELSLYLYSIGYNHKGHASKTGGEVLQEERCCGAS